MPVERFEMALPSEVSILANQPRDFQKRIAPRGVNLFLAASGDAGGLSPATTRGPGLKRGFDSSDKAPRGGVSCCAAGHGACVRRGSLAGLLSGGGDGVLRGKS